MQHTAALQIPAPSEADRKVTGQVPSETHAATHLPHSFEHRHLFAEGTDPSDMPQLLFDGMSRMLPDPEKPPSLCALTSSYPMKLQSELYDVQPNGTWLDRPHVPDGQELELLMLLSGSEAKQALDQPAQAASHADSSDALKPQQSDSCNEVHSITAQVSCHF